MNTLFRLRTGLLLPGISLTLIVNDRLPWSGDLREGIRIAPARTGWICLATTRLAPDGTAICGRFWLRQPRGFVSCCWARSSSPPCRGATFLPTYAARPLPLGLLRTQNAGVNEPFERVVGVSGKMGRVGVGYSPTRAVLVLRNTLRPKQAKRVDCRPQAKGRNKEQR